jgi:SulP family sulfate permease
LNGLILCQLMAGGLLILMGVLRIGKYIEHVPYAVTTGFTSGIAVVIATLALNDFLGLHIASFGPHYIDKVVVIARELPSLTPQEAVVGMATLGIIFGFARVTKVIPAPVAGIIGGMIVAYVAVKMGLSIDTIASRFQYILPDGETGAGIPPVLPGFHVPEIVSISPLIIPAITVALLAALESLLSATVADNITRDRHNPNAELVGAGFGNLAAGFFGGIPATGAIARTAANIHAGGKTPFASVMHAVFLLLFMLALARHISLIPMAALAALLLATAWRMAHIPVFIDILRAGNKKDTAVLLVTFFLTIFFDMVVGVGAGLALSYFLHILAKPR